MDYLTFRKELGVQILSETVTEAPEDIKVSIDTDRVNLISDTTGAEHPELIAEMVSGGIKYILSGRVTIPEMKQIVESLEYVPGTEAEESLSSVYTDEDIAAAEELIRK